MANTFHLEIVTPHRLFFSGPAEELIFPALDGLYGVEAGHEPEVTALSAGTLQYKADGVWNLAAVSDGFVEIMPDYVILLVSAAEHPDEIDENRALAAKARAEERLRQQQSLQEYHRSKAALARAMARLKTKGRQL